MDIYDGDSTGPVVYHGKTLTTKVPLREICAAIAKYAFVISPYPVIISAEVHCSLPQQDLLYKIMVEVFGDALVREQPPVEVGAGKGGGEGRGGGNGGGGGGWWKRREIERLPSPEELRGRVLLKAKDLYVSSGKAATGTGGTEHPYVLPEEDVGISMAGTGGGVGAIEVEESETETSTTEASESTDTGASLPFLPSFFCVKGC